MMKSPPLSMRRAAVLLVGSLSLLAAGCVTPSERGDAVSKPLLASSSDTSSAPRATGSNFGVRYIFAKTFVHDLDAMAAFYERVLGVIPNNRHQSKMFGRAIDEITFQASYPGGPALTLIKYMDSTGPTAGEAVQGFVTDDLEGLVARAIAAGGTVPEPIREIPGFGIKVAFVLDPEGHVNEVIQMLP